MPVSPNHSGEFCALFEQCRSQPKQFIFLEDGLQCVTEDRRSQSHYNFPPTRSSTLLGGNFLPCNVCNPGAVSCKPIQTKTVGQVYVSLIRAEKLCLSHSCIYSAWSRDRQLPGTPCIFVEQMNSVRGHYSHFIIEANSLPVNKWQNQSQYHCYSFCPVMFLGHQPQEERSPRHECRKQLYLTQKSGLNLRSIPAQRKISQENAGQKCGRESSCAAKVYSQCANRHWLGMCSSAASPAAELQNAAYLSGWNAPGSPDPNTSYLCLTDPYMVCYLGISHDKTQDSSSPLFLLQRK